MRGAGEIRAHIAHEADREAGVVRGAACAAERWERAMWRATFGEDWLHGLETLAARASEADLRLEAGSGELASTWFAARVGWAPASRGLAGAGSAAVGDTAFLRGAWVLRVAPGRVAEARELLEGITELAPEGAHPAIHVTESPVVLLPRLEGASQEWPERESWIRAFMMFDRARVGATVGGRVGARAGVRSSPPESFEDLMQSVAAPPPAAGRSRKLLDPAETRLRSIDRWRAALAWESDRAAYENARDVLKARVKPKTPAAPAKNAAAREKAVPRVVASVPGGGTVPFLPHTVFAHDSRPAASPWIRLARVFGTRCS